MSGGSSAATALIHSFLTRKRLVGSQQEYRMLTPICTAIEVQSYKNAIQLCNKLLKKQADHCVVQALKTVALSQASRPITLAAQQEILQIVEFVKTNANGAGLGDPDVLMFFGWVLGTIGKGEVTLAVLAQATQRHPDNEDVCAEAFLHYIRAGERKSSQQISMRMQRAFKNDKYLWWSVMSMLLQVSDTKNPTNELLLSLAERQITSHYTQLRQAAGLAPMPTTTLLPGSKLTIEAKAELAPDDATGKLDIDDVVHNGKADASPAGAEKEALVTPVSNKAPGREKGKGKAVPTSEALSATHAVSEPASPKTPKELEYDSAHQFHLITRFLELRVLHANAKAAASAKASSASIALVAGPTPPSLASSTPLVLPSLPTSELPLSVQQALLAHFASLEANKWCERGLGLEIWRREVELQHGSLEGGDWTTSWERLRKTLEKGDSNWHTMLYIIRTAFSVAAGSSKAFYADKVALPCSGPSESGLALLTRSRQLFRGLADDGEKGRKERGFLLALLEIARESRRREWADGESLATLVDEYYERFSSKMCCFDDLLPYLNVLSLAEQASLHEKSLVLTALSGDLSVVHVQRVITASKIARFVASISAEPVEDAAAMTYMQRYFDALPLGKGLPVTELQPADDFALLAGQAYVAAWQQSNQRSYLEKAIAILEFASLRSKHKYQIRILLVNLTRLLGASSLALAHYRLLGVKAIQFDTLSHLVLSRGSTFCVAAGTDAGVLEEATAALKWYTIGEHEAGEMPVRAFSFHNYSKIEDFTDFQTRLQRSLSKYILYIETLRMRVVRGLLESTTLTEAVAHLEFMLANKDVTLIDNRDFKTLPNLQSQSQSPIWAQTQMGPRTGFAWLSAFVAIYTRFLVPSAPTTGVDELMTPELTSSERGLLAFSRTARTALSADLDDVASEDAALAFFNDQTTQFTDAVDDPTRLPWELLHMAEIALEGFCLLDLAIEQRLADLIATKPADHAKLAKKLRTLRASARDIVRGLSSRLTSYGKQVGKQRNKTREGLASLTQFPLLDEDRLTTFAHGLVESRRAMAEGLGSAIHRRCAK